MTREVRAARPHLGGPSTTPTGSRTAAGAGPLLVGVLIGSLSAGRLEVAALCVAVGVVTAIVVGATAPPRRWWVALGFGALAGWGLNLYLTPGRPLEGWPPLAGRQATREGLVLGLLLTLRVAGGLAAILGLRAVWPGERAADALARLLAPLERLRVPVREARAMAGLALRFMPLVQAEARRIARVQDLRAGRPPRGAREWLVRRRAATVPLMVGSLERAERVALALEARHYRLRAPGAVTGWGAASGPAPGAWPGVVFGVALALTALLWRS